MKFASFHALFLLLLAGCLSSDAPDVKTWTVEAPAPDADAVRPMEGDAQLFSATRLGSIVVDAPFDRTQFVVRKPDGSVAIDHYNVFASSPSSLLRAPARGRLEANGRLGRVVGQGSVVSSDAQVEVVVKDLSIDCRTEGRRDARAAVNVDVVNTGRGPRALAFSGRGDASVDAQDGNYSQAFSQAFRQAFDAAMADALKNSEKPRSPR